MEEDIVVAGEILEAFGIREAFEKSGLEDANNRSAETRVASEYAMFLLKLPMLLYF